MSPKKRLLPAAEREEGHRRGHTDVDADIAGLGFVPELARRRPAGGEQAGLVAILPAVDQLDGLIDRVDMHQAEHRPKDFGLRRSRCRGWTSGRMVGRTKDPPS